MKRSFPKALLKLVELIDATDAALNETLIYAESIVVPEEINVEEEMTEINTKVKNSQFIYLGATYDSMIIPGSLNYRYRFPSTECHCLELKKTNKTDKRVLANLENPEKLLATILVSNSFVNIGIIVLLVHILNLLISIQNLPFVEFILQIVIISLFLLLFGEILPKIYVRHQSWLKNNQ